jgi:predicted nucleic acid-binding protein
VVRSPRRVVIDPNVLVSGAISSGGASAEVIDLIDAAVITPIVSPAVLAELSEVLGREKFRRYLDLESALAYITELERLGETWDDPDDVPRIAREWTRAGGNGATPIDTAWHYTDVFPQVSGMFRYWPSCRTTGFSRSTTSA